MVNHTNIIDKIQLSGAIIAAIKIYILYCFSIKMKWVIKLHENVLGGKHFDVIDKIQLGEVDIAPGNKSKDSFNTCLK